MNDVVIDLQHVTKQYGDFTAVNDLSLKVYKGEIFGLLGPNGAGKSTSILMMLGLTEASSGDVKINGVNSSLNPIEVKKHVGYLPEDVGFYNDMTAKENLMFTARLNGLSDDKANLKIEDLLKLVGLSSVANKKLGKFSKGMRQRLGLADVLIKDPKVIILDEPTAAIDPEGVKEILSLILKLRDEHQMTILFSSHNLNQVQQVCDRVGIFVKGHLLAQGNISELSEQLFGKDGCSLDEIYGRYFETKVI